jgi:hypothetical protein
LAANVDASSAKNMHCQELTPLGDITSMRSPIYYILIFAFALVTHCHSQQESLSLNHFNSEELNKLLTPGISLADVTNRFGLPSGVIQNTQNSVLLSYLALPSEINTNEVFPLAGFNVLIKNGHVVAWYPITTKIFNAPQFSTSTKVGDLSTEQTFKFFVEVDDLTNTLKKFDTEGTTDASNLNVLPDLTLKARVMSCSDESSNTSNQSIMLILGDPDVPKLEALTENNLGKRMLIVCHNKVVAVVRIAVPINSNKFRFQIRDLGLLK